MHVTKINPFKEFTVHNIYYSEFNVHEEIHTQTYELFCVGSIEFLQTKIYVTFLVLYQIIYLFL